MSQAEDKYFPSKKGHKKNVRGTWRAAQGPPGKGDTGARTEIGRAISVSKRREWPWRRVSAKREGGDDTIAGKRVGRLRGERERNTLEEERGVLSLDVHGGRQEEKRIRFDSSYVRVTVKGGSRFKFQIWRRGEGGPGEGFKKLFTTYFVSSNTGYRMCWENAGTIKWVVNDPPRPQGLRTAV
ncbi:hypothetical protein B0H17DRAFT_1150280 [Mycena rosella]|uniref:Uncharacterized protein n=1 Tax=Mycena rosella TaxID=1033263 RepID=A0AAD7FLZ8_MYCRO|nr:hypothetical protein B0H17DRAFT_1150280 [Mycena rosella]